MSILHLNHWTTGYIPCSYGAPYVSSSLNLAGFRTTPHNLVFITLACRYLIMMKSDLWIDLSHVLHHVEMEQSSANHSLLWLPDSVALSMFLFVLYSLCSSLTTYDLAVQRGVITSALFQVSPNFIATGSLARNIDRFPLAFLFRCRISASLDD